MAITVKEIHEKEFSRQVRGYNIDEVDDFLDAIASQLE
ncbi:MAG: DivIVA domain-containing protein, partial [Clostridiales bacterium]|nr:DivIVA domain-containing protein [Clostridiales bacterium]